MSDKKMKMQLPEEEVRNTLEGLQELLQSEGVPEDLRSDFQRMYDALQKAIKENKIEIS